MTSRLILAVAGSRKTQGIIDQCVAANSSQRILILTYTTANQSQIRSRLASSAGDNYQIEVRGWFSFLIEFFVRPYVPLLFSGVKVRGFDFESGPQRYERSNDQARFFNSDGKVRKVHLPQLAVKLSEVSGGGPVDRLERAFDRVFIDEVQDLCGYDLEVLLLLLRSKLDIEMVGDIRQAILATNPREAKNKQYMFMGIWRWFKRAQARGELEITQRSETWRCRPEIALLADSLFGEEWGFAPTLSLNTSVTNHDGVFLVKPEHITQYIERYSPLVLRHSASSWKHAANLTPRNFGEVKGTSSRHVLILPTTNIVGFLDKGISLESQQAARFYVAITRAEQSVAIVTDFKDDHRYPYWSP